MGPEVLATHRRAGPPNALGPPTQIAWKTVTSGKMTSRLEWLDRISAPRFTGRPQWPASGHAAAFLKQTSVHFWAMSSIVDQRVVNIAPLMIEVPSRILHGRLWSARSRHIAKGPHAGPRYAGSEESASDHLHRSRISPDIHRQETNIRGCASGCGKRARVCNAFA